MKLRKGGFVLLLALFSVSLLWPQSITEPTLEERYADLKLKYDSLNSTYQQLLTKSKGYEATLREVLESSARLIQLLEKARSDLTISQGDLQALTLSSQELEKRLQAINEELAATKLQLADYESKLASLQTELADLKQRLQDSETKLAGISAQYDALLIDYQALTERFQTLSAKYDALLTQYSAALEKITNLETQLAEALKSIDILQGELDKVKKEMSQKWWEGLGIGAGGATVIFFILYFTVLPNVR